MMVFNEEKSLENKIDFGIIAQWVFNVVIYVQMLCLFTMFAMWLFCDYGCNRLAMYIIGLICFIITITGMSVLGLIGICRAHRQCFELRKITVV